MIFQKFLDFSRFFRTPTAREIAQRDIEEARRKFLAEKAAAEYHEKLAEYYAGVEKRLNQFVRQP